MGGATFPTGILLNSQIDRHPGSVDANSGITTLALPSGQSGNGHEHYKIPLCITLKENVKIMTAGLLNRISSCNSSFSPLYPQLLDCENIFEKF